MTSIYCFIKAFLALSTTLLFFISLALTKEEEPSKKDNWLILSTFVSNAILVVLVLVESFFNLIL